MDLRLFIAAVLHPLPNSPWTSVSDHPDPRKAIGDAGERFSVAFLRHHGLKVLYRNFKGAKGGEVDIVARDEQDLVFIEVKTRTGVSHGRPSDAVTGPKQRLITRGAMEWVKMLRQAPKRCRFDVVEVYLQEGKRPVFEHLKDAFEVPKDLQAEM